MPHYTRQPLYDDLGVIVRSGDGESVSKLDPEFVFSELRRGCVVILRGFRSSVGSFAALTRRLHPRFMRHGVSALREADEDSETPSVIIGDDRVSLHVEMGYLPVRPDALWMYCVVPPTRGGQTSVVDGARLLESLPTQLRAFVEGNAVAYRHRLGARACENFLGIAGLEGAAQALSAWDTIDEVEIAGAALRFRYCAPMVQWSRFGSRRVFLTSAFNAHQVSRGVEKWTHRAPSAPLKLATGEGFPLPILEALERAAEDASRTIEWQAGDVALFDNSRVMHGRRAFVGPRTILTRFGLGYSLPAASAALEART